MFKRLGELQQEAVDRLEYEEFVGQISLFSDTKRVEDVEETISFVKGKYSSEYFQNTYNNLVSRAKRTPIEKAVSYGLFKEMLGNALEEVVDIDDKVRRDMNIVENVGFQVPPDEATEEEIAALQEDIKNRKIEAAKKLKSKPKTEEEDAADAV